MKLLLILFLSFGVLQTPAQTWKLDRVSSPQIEVTGTSSLHDWKVTCAGILEVPESFDLQIANGSTIKEFGFKVPVDSMDGGRGASMNTKIYGAFQSSQNPFITYRQTEPATITTTSGGNFTLTSKGTLSQAGVRKAVEVLCSGTVNNGLLTLTGSKELKMSDFNMEPPTAMFGQIKTHDDIVVHFEFHYKLIKDE